MKFRIVDKKGKPVKIHPELVMIGKLPEFNFSEPERTIIVFPTLVSFPPLKPLYP